MRVLCVVCIGLAVATMVARAQSVGAGQSGRRPLLPREREIALARSAAPPAVSDSATIYVLGDREYELAVRGSNGNACYVSRAWVESLEPQCFDAEGAATVLPMEMHRVALLHQGRSLTETDRAIADGLASGGFRLPRRPAMSYMMSAEQRLISDDGRSVGRWQPHLMLYVPYVTAAELGLGATPDLKTAVVNDGGKPLANVMVVLREFVQSAGPPATTH